MDEYADFVKNTKECIYCGSHRKIQKDHVIAQSKGGVTVVPACYTCNPSKNNKPLMEWFNYLKINRPRKWAKICAFNKGKRHIIAQKVHCVRDGKPFVRELK